MFSAMANGRGSTYFRGNGYQMKANTQGCNKKFPARPSIFDSRTGRNVMEKIANFPILKFRATPLRNGLAHPPAVVPSGETKVSSIHCC